MTPSLEGWPNNAEEAPSPHLETLTPLDANPVLHCHGGPCHKESSPVGWLLYDKDLCHKRVSRLSIIGQAQPSGILKWKIFWRKELKMEKMKMTFFIFNLKDTACKI